MEVLKLTTLDGKEFYTDASDFTLADLQEIVDRTCNVHQVDHLYMTEEEYRQIPATSGALSFFGRLEGRQGSA